MESRPSGGAILPYLAATAVVLAALAVIYDLPRADLRVPFYYTVGADTWQSSLVVKTVIETGWCLRNPRLGAPGELALHDFPTADTLNVLLIRALAPFARHYGVCLNLFFLLTFFLTSWTALFALLRLGISRAVAVVGAVLYAFLPYHFLRGQWHLFLASYEAVPLAALVALWLADGRPILFDGEGGRRPRWRPDPSRAALAVGSCLLIALSGAYYAFFATSLVLAGAVIGAARPGVAARLMDGAALAGTVALAFALQLAPNLHYRWEHGKNPEVAVRTAHETRQHGLDLASMVRPVPGKPALSALGRRSASSDPARLGRLIRETEERGWGALGGAATAGLAALLLVLLRGTRAEGLRSLDAPARLTLAAVLLGIPGGGGTLFAQWVTPQIRCGNRIAIFIAFFAIAALMMLLDRLRMRWARSARARLAFGALLAATLGVGLLDQIPAIALPDGEGTRAEFAADREFVRAIEAALGGRGAVFQLPYVVFPENLPVHDLHDYELLRGYLHSASPHVRWSYPAMRGRGADDWLRRTAELPAGAMVARLAEAGFGAIYLDRDGFADRGEELEAGLSSALHRAPIVSADGHRTFFLLPPRSPHRGR